MSGSANFTRSYKIPRRQNDGKNVVDKIQPSTSSPLTKKVTVGKNNVPEPSPNTKPLKANAPVNNHPKFKTQHRPSSSSNQQRHRNNQSQVDSLNNQRTTKRRLGEHEQNAILTQKNPCHRSNNANVNANNSNDDPMELLDRIWQQMDDADRKKTTEEQQKDGSISPTASPFLQAATPTPSVPTLKLTRHELMNAPRDETIFRSFLSKEGLMERILGYKMQHSRVDTYEVMKKPAKLEECQRPATDDVDYGVPIFHSIEPSTSSHFSNRRGPQTPPGSPNHEQDDAILSADEWNNKSIHSPSSLHSKIEAINPISVTQPPLLDETTDKEFSSRAELLQTFSQATNTPVEKLEEMIGVDLQHAIGRVAKSVLLNTLKDAIRNVSSNSPKSSLLNRVSEQGAFNSPVLTGGNEMQCSSTDSNATANEFSPPMLPPPPEPPTVNRPTTSSNNRQNIPVHPIQIRPPINFNEPPPINSSQPFQSQLMRPPPRILLDTTRPPPNISKVMNMPPRNAMFSSPPPRIPMCVPPPNRLMYPPPPIPMMNQFSRPPPIVQPGNIPPFFQALNQPEQTVFQTLIRSIGARDLPPQRPTRPHFHMPRRP